MHRNGEPTTGRIVRNWDPSREPLGHGYTEVPFAELWRDHEWHIECVRDDCDGVATIESTIPPRDS